MLVVLNDNDMSISPPVGALNKYLARLMSGRFYDRAREGAKRVLKTHAAVRARAPLRGTCQGHGGAGHDLRGVRLQLRRPDRRPRPRRADPDAGEPARQARAAVPARRHEEGLRLQAGRGRPGQLPRPAASSTRRSACQKPKTAPKTDLHAGLRPVAVRHGRRRRAAGRHHAGDARRLGHGRVREALPAALLRRRHRRAARGDLRRRAGLRRA